MIKDGAARRRPAAAISKMLRLACARNAINFDRLFEPLRRGHSAAGG